MFIAEIKTRSPFGFRSTNSWRQLFELALRHGEGISIHTDARFNGSFLDIGFARCFTDKFVLAKGLHRSDDEIKRALDLGASAVLVVGRIPPDNLIERCWIEPNDLSMLHTVPKGITAVWNARDLRTGRPKIETWTQARQIFEGELCQASMIRQPKDIAPDAQSFIVGEHLPAFIDAISK